MTTRTTSTRVAFFRSFQLNGMDRRHPAGSYIVETDEELPESSSVPGRRRTATYIVLPGHPGSASVSQTVEIEPGELQTVLSSKLEAALTEDAATDRAELTLDDLLADHMVRKAISSSCLTVEDIKEQLRHLTGKRARANVSSPMGRCSTIALSA